jgi:quercetin dioxygenase-like cupin family protein
MIMNKIEFHPKGWGFEKWIVNSREYCGKILYFVKGRKCSWHYHKVKDETFYIQSGAIILYHAYDDNIEVAEKKVLRKGDKFHIPVGLRHRMYALEDTELFEFSTQHFEDDSYRVIKGD